jgi:hypothetical protein
VFLETLIFFSWSRRFLFYGRQRLKTLPCKIIIVAKTKKVKTEWSNSRQIWQNLPWKAVAKRRVCFANDDDDGRERFITVSRKPVTRPYP